MERMDIILEHLIQTIQLLAADYQTQLSSLPDYVFIPDEVVSNFDEVYLLFPQLIQKRLLNETQIDSVISINNKLSEMNDKHREIDIWSLKAMKNNPDWEELRKIAKDALSTFGLSVTSTKLDWIIYIKSKKPNV